MAISKYETNGRVLWKVYVNVRSTKNSKIRLQKRITEIESEHLALQEEKRILRQLGEKIARLEADGDSWANIIGRWETAMEECSSYHITTVKDHVACLHKWTASWLKLTAASLN